MKGVYRKVQFFSHIATIVIALLLGLIVIKQYLTPSWDTNDATVTQSKPNIEGNPRSNATVTPVGKPVPIENVDWRGNVKTLVLYISTSCRYCNESAPFYQRLVKQNSGKGLKIIAVLPQPVDEAKEYLKSHDINISEVYNTSLASIGVSATPTLLLVNESGIVSESWRGKLAADKEKQVFERL